MKLNFQMYIKKFHYYQKVSCVKTFKKRFFYFLCLYFPNMDFTIANSKLLLCLRKIVWNLNPVWIFQILCNTLIKTFNVYIFMISI